MVDWAARLIDNPQADVEQQGHPATTAGTAQTSEPAVSGG